MIDYLRYFFAPSHFFNLRPLLMSERALWLLGGIAVAFLACAVVAKVLARRSRNGMAIKGYRKISALGLTMGVVGLLLLFFNYEGAVLLSARFWVFGWLVAAVVWAAVIVKYFWRDVPRQQAELDQRRKFAKYLP